MKREDLDHLLRAAGDLTGHKEFVLAGSNAIFAWRQRIPNAMALSREADLFAAEVSDDEAEHISDQLEEIGHLSPFDDTHGYYVDGVGPHTAVLPSDWRLRSMRYSSPATNGVTALVPHPEDIALSKLCAGREKDLEWINAAYAAGFINLNSLTFRVPMLPNQTESHRRHILDLIEGLRRTDKP